MIIFQTTDIKYLLTYTDQCIQNNIDKIKTLFEVNDVKDKTNFNKCMSN